MAEENQNANGAESAQQAQSLQFNIQRIYTKDISFESPNAPAIFQKEWKPEIKLDIDTSTNKMGESAFEVVLSVTVTASMGDETAFLCEVEQAGIFTIAAEMPDQAKAPLLGSYCPNLLFPYAREAISNMVNRGSFPPLNLAPVNFDAIFAAYMQKRAQQAQEGNQHLDA